MLTVALTGNVAAGKSTVADLWRAAGVPVVSADALAREVTAPGSSGLEEIRRVFGETVLAADGSLDREAMRGVVFRDPDARARLEAILHPRIDALRRAWLEARERDGARLVVAEIPLLFEVGLQDAHDVSVLVTAPSETRLRRLVNDRGVDAGEARRIMDAQMDSSDKVALADYVLENDGTLDDLRTRALHLLDELGRRESQGARGGKPRSVSRE